MNQLDRLVAVTTKRYGDAYKDAVDCPNKEVGEALQEVLIWDYISEMHRLGVSVSETQAKQSLSA